MLDDILPPGAFETNCRVSEDSNEVVEFALVMPMRGDARPLLAIDAKFPSRTTNACSPPPTRATSRRSVRHAVASNAAFGTSRPRSRRNTSGRRAPSISPCSIVPTDALYAEIARLPV